MNNAVSSRKAFTLIELLIVIGIIAMLIQLLVPAIQSSREAARRTQCQNKIKQLAVAVHNYEGAHEMFPPGFVAESSLEDGEIWIEAESGKQGTSWMLQVLPYVEQSSLYNRWDFAKNVAGNKEIAQVDIPLFYCPSRRSGVRDDDVPLMFMNWRSGGTDYGGCAGSANYFYDDGPSSSVPFSHRFLTDELTPENIGVFYANSETRFADITDGTSNTLMLGELQRVHYLMKRKRGNRGSRTSHDGWASGGVCNLFDTNHSASSNSGRINNGQFESPGSEHPGGALFSMADGSVRFIRDDVNRNIFRDMGSIAEGAALTLP